MDAIILAAGRGARLKPLTNTSPKPLLEVANLSLIEIHLYQLAQAGFKNIVINVHHLGQLIQDKLGSGKKYGLNIQYSIEKDFALETAGGIIQALHYVKSEQFAVISADVLSDYPLSNLKTPLKDELTARLVLVDNPKHHPNGDFSLNKSALLYSDETSLRYTFSGIGCFSKKLFLGLASGKRALRPVFEQAILDQTLSGEHYAGIWSDVGTLERLEHVRQSSKVRQYIESIKQSIN